jgi:chloride channel protein, CIC family
MSTAPPTEPASVASHPRRWRFTEEHLFLLLAILIGILSGLAVVCFRITIETVRLWLFGSGVHVTPQRMVAVPVLTSLVVAVLVMVVFPRVRGSGVNQTKAALYIYDGFIPFRTAIGKFICSALAIGGGQSLGPEDPSLQIGASIASLLGRKLQLSRERLRLIAPVGAAAGLAAAFNAPISAVLFVIEEVVGRWSAGIFGAVVLSAVSSVVVSRWFLGSQPLFRIPAVQFFRPAELIAYAVLGVVGAFASVVFARLIGFLRPRLKALPRWTQYLQPAIAGLLIGLIGYLGAPQVMGAGYDSMDQAMHGQFTWQLLGMLAGLKILSTTLSFTSGTPGGMFAPTLFIGAMLGGAVGGAERVFFSSLTGSIGTYALVGMGVLFAGFLRAPMTSVFMVLEVSGDYSIILPVLVSNTIAYLLARNLQPVPIFDMLSRQDGVDLPSMEEEREAVIYRVEDAMRPLDVPVMHGEMRVENAMQRLNETGATAALVDDWAGGWGTVTRAALQQAVLQRHDAVLRELLPPTRMEPLFPDNQLEIAMQRMNEWPFLPVVHRADPRQVIGVISMQDVVKAYKRST